MQLGLVSSQMNMELSGFDFKGGGQILEQALHARAFILRERMRLFGSKAMIFGFGFF